MTAWNVTRARLALVVILVYAGVSTIRWLHRGFQRSARPTAQDEISNYEQRFAELRKVLPAHGVVGYLGHPEPRGSTPRDSNAAALLHFRRYLLAQYTLAPLLLIESTEPEFVVGNFDRDAAIPEPTGLRLVRDFGGGLVLLRRSEP